MVGCKEKDESSWLLTAAAPRSDVFFDTTNNPYTLHEANGLTWYYHEKRAMGFAGLGASVLKNPCDSSEDTDGNRLCWRIFTDGWRCGTHIGIRDDTFYRGEWTAE